MPLKITKKERTVEVFSEYNSYFVEGARNLGGKWRNECWVFDIREEDDVKKLCMEAYGEDGVNVDQVDVEIVFKDEFYAPKGPIDVFGRTIARAFGRDSGAKLGDGVKLIEGEFYSSGSMKNWRTEAKDGTIVLIRDVSKFLVEQNDNPQIEANIVSINSTKKTDEKESLLAELYKIRAREDEILRRLKEIDPEMVKLRKEERLKNFKENSEFCKKFLVAKKEAEESECEIHESLVDD